MAAIRPLALALLILTSACERTDPGGALSAAPAPAPPAPFWLREVDLAAEKGGPPTRHIEGPVRVEVAEDGFVLGAAENADGFLDPSIMKEPADRHGLMLYAQRVAEMHFGTPDGPVFGRLHPGALVGVAPRGGDTWEIAVPRYGLRAFVERDALGVEPTSEVPPVLAGSVYRDHDAALSVADGAGATRLLCGEFRVLDGEAIQYSRGVEIRGRLDVPPFASFGDNSCGAASHWSLGGRFFSLAPGADWLDRELGWTVFPDNPLHFPNWFPDNDPLTGFIRQRWPMFWLVRSTAGLFCEEWRFGPFTVREGGRGPTGEVLETSMSLAVDRSVTLHVSYEERHRPMLGHVVFSGPQLRTPRRVFVATTDGKVVYVVDDRGRDLDRPLGDPAEEHVHAGGDPAAIPAGAWLSDLEQDGMRRWFWTKSRCEEAIAQTKRRIARAPELDHKLGFETEWYRRGGARSH